LFSFLSDLFHFFHHLDGLTHDFPIVLFHTVASLFKVKRAVHGHFFAGALSVCFGPFHFPWVSFQIEVFVALGPAKSKDFAIVAHKHDPMGRVDGRGTKVTFMNPHGVGRRWLRKEGWAGAVDRSWWWLCEEEGREGFTERKVS
jgi:hypothetical protein